MNSRFLSPAKHLLFSLLLATAVHAAPDRDFKTTPVMKLETRTLVQLLEVYHYNKDAVTPADFPQLISDYMREGLDPYRLFFTAEDEKNFRAQYGPRVETDLAYLGNIDTAFTIFKAYEDRVKARVAWINEELKKDYDFTKQETYAPDRSKSDFPATAAEADDLWRRRIKFEILQDILAKKTPEQAKASIHKRYDRLVKNVGDIEPLDIQEMFLSAFTRMYDPHSAYLSSDTLQDFSIQMKLSLIGIGAVLGIEDDGNCVVKEVKPGSEVPFFINALPGRVKPTCDHPNVYVNIDGAQRDLGQWNSIPFDKALSRTKKVKVVFTGENIDKTPIDVMVQANKDVEVPCVVR